MTNDVPGAVCKSEKLDVGHWAESEDKSSLILVEGVSEERVIYSVFDLSRVPPMEYRDAMPLNGFEKTFSKSKSSEPLGGVWGWHDKTVFPWDRVIDSGLRDGIRYTCAEDQLSAALEVATKRGLINSGTPVDYDELKSFRESSGVKGLTIINKLQKAINRLKS